MNGLRMNRLVAVLMTLALMLAACGGGDGTEQNGGGDDGSPTAEETAAGSPTEGETDEVAAACEPLEEPAVVRANIPFKILLFAPILLAQEMGEFEKENITIEAQDVGSPDDYGFVSRGDLDVTVGSVNAGVFNAVDRGLDIYWGAPSHVNNEDSLSGIWAQSEFFDENGEMQWSQLEGEKVGTLRGVGGTVTYSLSNFLDQAGLGLGDIEIERLGGSDVLVALEQGAVSAGWLIDPVWLQAEENPDLMFAGTMPVEQNGGAYLIGPSFLEERRDVGVAFFRAMLRTVRDHLQGDYLADEETLQALVSATGQSEESLSAVPPPVFDPDLDIEDPSWLVDMQQTFIEAGGVLEYEEPIDPTAFIDQTLVEEARSCLDEES